MRGWLARNPTPMSFELLALIFLVAGTASLVFSDRLSALFGGRQELDEDSDFEIPPDLWRPAFILLGIAWLIVAVMFWLER